nr:cysteine-rich receptor-like protein kinase [Tanacetum cinerariifolium]
MLSVDSINFGPKCFKFFNHWMEDDNFNDIFKSSWGTGLYRGTADIILKNKLKKLKLDVKNQWKIRSKEFKRKKDDVAFDDFIARCGLYDFALEGRRFNRFNKKDPFDINDYRPICLIGCMYKVLSKLLASRPSKIIHKLIHPNQTTFLSERHILDGVLVANEIINHAMKEKLKLLLFKFDFEKAFNSINWRFFMDIMSQMGFVPKWHKWISACLSSALISVLISLKINLRKSHLFGIRVFEEEVSAVTYTSISSDSDGPSWGIPLMNAVYVLEPEHPEYHAPSDDDIQVEDDDEDLEEDPNEEHEPEDDDKDPEEDPNVEHELEDEDTKEPYEGSDETKPFEEDETVVTPPPPRHRRARIYAPLDRMAAMTRMRDHIPEEDMPPWRRIVLTAPPPGCDVAESYDAAARAPKSQYDFVDTVEAGQGLIRSPGHDARTIARVADKAEDVGYVRALHASEHRMMTSIEKVNLRISYQAQVRRQESKYFYTQLHDAQTDRKDIRLDIDVVRRQRTAYETELQEVHQAYLSSEAHNRELFARLETLETHKSRMEWQRQSAEDLAVT